MTEERSTSGRSITRRQFVAGAAAFAAAAVPGVSFAQSALDNVLAAPSRGGWNDEFDTRSASTSEVVSYQPVLSQNTAMAMQNAIASYNQLVMSGGWPMVPDNAAMQLGVQGPAVQALRERLYWSGDLPRSAGGGQAFDSYVDAAVRRFQTRHGLPSDGVVGETTFRALNVPANMRLGQLQTNLSRIQAEQITAPKAVVVNIPGAFVEAVENGRVVQRHTAVVGKVDRQTPILQSEIINLNLNPYWHAPASIVRRDIIPLMRQDPTYLARNEIYIYAADGTVIPPETIDWNTEEAVRYLFRQEPGRMNAMSSVRINFPNPHSVFLHDTPQQSTFSQLMRFESSGCVRIQNVRDLIVWIARDEPGWDRARIEQTIAARSRTDIDLTNRPRVHLSYITAWASDPTAVQFRDDIYHRDGSQQLAMSNVAPQAYQPGEQAYADMPF